MECYWSCIIKNFKIFFHPAKFDNFKDETISDCKTLSVPQSQILAGLKTSGITSNFLGHFFSVLGCKKSSKRFFKKIVASALKSCIKLSLKNFLLIHGKKNT